MTNKNVLDIFNVQLHYGEMKALMEILDFAHRAATVLAHQELIKGSGAAGASKMASIARDAKELHYIIAKNTDIGDPVSGAIN
jgi:hypothetical protein